LEATPPDACLVSNTLAGMPTTRFVRECRQRRDLQDMTIVVMAVTPRAAIEVIREGAQGCVRKPLDSGSAYAALDTVLH
jgi:DNA-binding NarL/FixJ family response regulator